MNLLTGLTKSASNQYGRRISDRNPQAEMSRGLIYFGASMEIIWEALKVISVVGAVYVLANAIFQRPIPTIRRGPIARDHGTEH